METFQIQIPCLSHLQTILKQWTINLFGSFSSYFFTFQAPIFTITRPAAVLSRTLLLDKCLFLSLSLAQKEYDVL